MPGKHTKADIYLDVGEMGNLHGAWLAKVDLGILGITVIWKRKIGQIKYVYVKSGNQDARSLQAK
jgi:hypothetical protein